MFKVFIDGSVGTTGLRIFDRLKDREDIELLTLPEELRKDVLARKEKLNTADVVFLCLPDDASRQAVSLIENKFVKVIDTSTAHRTAHGWTYGFPELSLQRDKIKQSKRIANPGCHASGVIALIKPLIENGLLSKNAKFSAFSITGYTGGGKKMIAEYEVDRPALYEAPRQYGLTQAHKHLPEIKSVCALKSEPVFSPIVASFPCGMQVTVPLHASMVKSSVEKIKECYKDYYNSGVVRYSEETENGLISASSFAGKDSMAVSVFGNEERLLLVSRFDNLGKGASGAAIQNMNVLLEEEETKGLIL